MAPYRGHSKRGEPKLPLILSHLEGEFQVLVDAASGLGHLLAHALFLAPVRAGDVGEGGEVLEVGLVRHRDLRDHDRGALGAVEPGDHEVEPGPRVAALALHGLPALAEHDAEELRHEAREGLTLRVLRVREVELPQLGLHVGRHVLPHDPVDGLRGGETGDLRAEGTVGLGLVHHDVRAAEHRLTGLVHAQAAVLVPEAELGLGAPVLLEELHGLHDRGELGRAGDDLPQVEEGGLLDDPDDLGLGGRGHTVQVALHVVGEQVERSDLRSGQSVGHFSPP